MKKSLLLLAILTLAGCGSTPQPLLSYDKNHFSDNKDVVGVYYTERPEVDTHLFGANCLLCYAVASAANSGLTKHVQTLTSQDLSALGDDVVKIIGNSNVDVKKISTLINFAKLAKFKTKELNFAKKDHRSLKETLGIDKLIVISLTTIGAHRSYSSYVPNGGPSGSVSGLVYSVDLTTNKFELYQQINNHVPVQGEWDEPPTYPGLTNSYYQALDMTNEQVLGMFR
jgi:hypothetical protein